MVKDASMIFCKCSILNCGYLVMTYQAAFQSEVLESLEGGIILTSPAVRVKAAHPVIGVWGYS